MLAEGPEAAFAGHRRCPHFARRSALGRAAGRGSGRAVLLCRGPTSRRLLPWAAAFFVAGVALAGVAARILKPTPSRPVTRAVITLPAGEQLAGIGPVGFGTFTRREPPRLRRYHESIADSPTPSIIRIPSSIVSGEHPLPYLRRIIWHSDSIPVSNCLGVLLQLREREPYGLLR